MCTGREMGSFRTTPRKISNPDSRPKCVGEKSQTLIPARKCREMPISRPIFGDPDPQKFNPSLTCSGRGPHSPLRIFFLAIGTP